MRAREKPSGRAGFADAHRPVPGWTEGSSEGRASTARGGEDEPHSQQTPLGSSTTLFKGLCTPSAIQRNMRVHYPWLYSAYRQPLCRSFRLELCGVAISIAFVLMAELLNTAVERS